jgi:hypothetical protein
LPKTIGTGPLEVVDDPSFPFDREALDDGAQVAGRWLAATDSGDASRLRAEMSEGFASNVESKRADWERQVAERGRFKLNGQRRELYRLQTTNRNPSRPGSNVWVVVAVDVVGVGNGVEKVRLERESGRWRVGSYAILFPKAKWLERPQ